MLELNTVDKPWFVITDEGVFIYDIFSDLVDICSFINDVEKFLQEKRLKYLNIYYFPKNIHISFLGIVLKYSNKGIFINFYVRNYNILDSDCFIKDELLKNECIDIKSGVSY